MLVRERLEWHRDDMSERSTLVAQAETLAASGRVAEARALLEPLAARGDANALFALGIWALTGAYVQRDLTASREFFRLASQRGSREGSAVYRAFLANGTGGAPEWQRAVGLLKEASDTEPAAKQQLALIDAMKLTPAGDPTIEFAAETLSISPAVSLFPGLLTPAECAYLMGAAEPLLEPALVVHPATGELVPNPVRTSEATAFPLASEDPAIHALNRRMAMASATHVSQGEPLQVLRYQPGQQYRPHSDALARSDNQRILTLLVYLNDGYEGGETLFTETGLSVRGQRGDALLFRNVGLDGRPDPLARHAGLPVKNGTKWLASRWIRARPLDLSQPSR